MQDFRKNILLQILEQTIAENKSTPIQKKP